MGFCDPKKWISRKLGPNYKKNLHFSHCVTFFFSRMWKLWWPILYIPLWIRSEAFKFYFHCLPSWIYPLLSLQPRTKPQMTNPSLPQPLAQSLELRELRIRAYGIIFFYFYISNRKTKVCRNVISFLELYVNSLDNLQNDNFYQFMSKEFSFFADAFLMLLNRKIEVPIPFFLIVYIL